MSESDWTTRLPYAHRYITKTLFEGAEADLDPPEEIFFMEPTYQMGEPDMRLPELLYSRWSTKVLLEHLKSHYFEFSVGLEPGGYSWVAVGYTANR